MATHIFDIDGTLVGFHTNQWLDGAKEHLLRLSNDGHQIILITARNERNDNGTIWSPESTRKTLLKDLDECNINYRILFDVSSPRILFDDTPCKAITRKKDSKWPC